MRITTYLCSQHIGNGFKRLWKTQSQRKVLDFGVRQQLQDKGIPVFDATQLVGLNPATITAPVVENTDPRRNRRNWREDACKVYHDQSSLLGGVSQGLVLTKTQLLEGLPARLEATWEPASEEVHERVRQATMNAHVLDATQIKLPRAIDLRKPGWSHPREYGVPKWKRNKQLVNKLFHICDTTLAAAGVDVSQGQFLNESKLQVQVEDIVFNLEVHNLLMSKKPLKVYAEPLEMEQILANPLPDIYPLSPSLGIFESNIYRPEQLFPVKKQAPYPYINMAVFPLNMPFIKYTESQLEARLLVHSFAVASAWARQHYGEKVTHLPEPVVLQAVHTDSQNFLFGCLQLHSLDLNSTSASNILWMSKERLFDKCHMEQGRPILAGYNDRVLNTLLAMLRSNFASN